MGTSDWVSTSMPYLTARGKGQPDAWGAEAGKRGSQRIVHAGEVAAPAEVAEALGVAEGDAVVVRRRMMFFDGRPCELTDTYYPLDIAGGPVLPGRPRSPGVRSRPRRARARWRTRP